jgi:hypothetical protein
MRELVDGGVGTGTPGCALGGGPGGQGSGAEPEGGGGATSNNRKFSDPADAGLAGLASASTSSSSTTTDCEPIAPNWGLGAVGEFNWLHDTIVKAAPAVTKEAMNRGDVNDICNSLKSSLVGFPTILRQKVNHDLRPNPRDFGGYPQGIGQAFGDFGWAKRAKRKGFAKSERPH